MLTRQGIALADAKALSYEEALMYEAQAAYEQEVEGIQQQMRDISNRPMAEPKEVKKALDSLERKLIRTEANYYRPVRT